MSTNPQVLLRIRTNIRDRKGRYPDQIIADSAVNPTLRELENYGFTRPVSANFNTVGTQKDYPFSVYVPTMGLIHHVESVRIGTDRTLLDWAPHSDMPFNTSGRPTRWGLWSGGFEFDPIPGGVDAIYIDAYCSPTMMDPGSIADDLQVDAFIEDAIVAGSSWRMCIIHSEPARAAHFFGEYDRLLKMIRAKIKPDRSEPVSVIDVSGLDAYIEQYD